VLPPFPAFHYLHQEHIKVKLLNKFVVEKNRNIPAQMETFQKTKTIPETLRNTTQSSDKKCVYQHQKHAITKPLTHQIIPLRLKMIMSNFALSHTEIRAEPDFVLKQPRKGVF